MKTRLFLGAAFLVAFLLIWSGAPIAPVAIGIAVVALVNWRKQLGALINPGKRRGPSK